MPDQDVEPFRLHIRRRPGIYIGGANGRGLREMIDGIIFEQFVRPGAKFDRVITTLLPDGFLQIEIIGAIGDVRPDHLIDPHGTFDDLPLVIAAALSDPIEVQVLRDGRRWSHSLAAGVPLHPPKWADSDGVNRLLVRFRPDPSIFKNAPIRFLSLCGMIQERALFFPQTLFRVEDQTGIPQRRDFQYPLGLRSYVEEIDHEWIDFHQMRGPLWHLKQSEGADRAEAVIFYRGIDPGVLHSFVNGKRSPAHGSHVDGFKRAIAEIAGRLPEDSAGFLSRSEDLLEGTTVIVAVQLEDPNWHNSTKSQLSHPVAEQLIYRMVIEQLPAQMAKIEESS